MNTEAVKPRVLIVDDEKNTRDGLERALRRQYDVYLAADGRQALEVLSETQIDVMLSDVRMPGMDGLTLLQRALALESRPIVILLTAYGTVDVAVEAMKKGAYDFLRKPVNLDRLEILLKRALRNREMETENRDLRSQLDEKYGLDQIIGDSPAMHEVFDTIRQVAPTRTTVLVEGESGTGKELVAKALHRLSPRSGGPFVAVHCAALSETLLESELFGHEKGAFTGAVESRAGRFEMADGGTLFLDEIAEIDTSVQVKILRVLEERNFERVGGQKTLDVDVRLIAATNRDLHEMVREGTFREDLFYRLHVVALRLPPLRERRGDIERLLHHFLGEFNRENNRQIDGVTPEAMNLLAGYSWPGNVRELRNVIERMVVLTRNERLGVRDVPAYIREEAGDSAPPPRDGAYSLETAERELIERALKANGGNRTKAAEELGISRRTLHRKLNEYGLRDG